MYYNHQTGGGGTGAGGAGAGGGSNGTGGIGMMGHGHVGYGMEDSNDVLGLGRDGMNAVAGGYTGYGNVLGSRNLATQKGGGGGAGGGGAGAGAGGMNLGMGVSGQLGGVTTAGMGMLGGSMGVGLGGHQGGMDNRVVYPTSQHHQVQLAIHQRSRASATPHHHAKAAMVYQRNQANLAAIMSSGETGGAENGEDAGGVGTHRSPSARLRGGRTPLHGVRGVTPIQQVASTRSSTGFEGSNVSYYSESTAGQQSNGKEGEMGWTALDMGGMGLRVLGNDLFRYTFLTKLYINHNQLKYIPPQIAQLRQLEVLDGSGNQFTAVPPQLGLCCRLKELLLFDNRLTELPYELGSLYMLDTLGLEGNPVHEPIRGILQKDGTRAVIEYLRELAPATRPPEDRRWIVLDKTAEQGSPDIITVATYNTLAAKYGSSQQYSYCPSWALSWENRREVILSELQSLAADIVCLQEVETGDYTGFFRDRLRAVGYESEFWARSRARTMTEEERKTVDGCATFYKADLFEKVSAHVIEFQQKALNHGDFKKSQQFFSRFMTKDNISGVTMLRHKRQPAVDICVANVHVYWDPGFTDVKMAQVAMLVEELKHTLGSNSKNTCLLICGDFNSTPDSGLYEFLSTSKLSNTHPDLAKLEGYSNYREVGLTHSFNLRSAYQPIGELSLTNYTPTYCGVLDYIWYSQSTLTPTGVLGPIDSEWIKDVVGFPNQHIPSDHIPIMAEFRIKKQL